MGVYSKSHKLSLVGYVFLCSQLLIACRPDIKSGFYSGNISKRDNQGSWSEKIHSKLTIEKGKYGHLEVKNIDDQLVDSIDVIWNENNNKIKFKIDSLNLVTELSAVERVKPRNRMYCYAGSAEYVVKLCFSKHNQFYLNVTSQQQGKDEFFLAIDGMYDSQQVPLVMEPAKSFTRSEAIQNVFSKSFDQAIEYQLLMQSKQKARAAWFDLIPHLDFKNIFAISSEVPRTIANFVGDFVPFVFPNRWFKAKEASHMYEAEELTLDILRADLAYNIESMGFSFDREQLNNQFYRAERKKIEKAIAHVTKIGESEIGKIGTIIDELAFRLELIENFIRQDKNRLENAMDLEKTALAFQMGFNNPHAIEAFDVQSKPKLIEKAIPLNSDHIVKAALERSLELKQLDQYIMNAEYQKREWYFNWADPDVPGAAAVSVSLIPNLKKASAYIGEMIARRSKVAAQVQMNAANAVINYNRALELYKITEQSIDQLQIRESLIYDDIDKALKAPDLHTNGPSAQYALNTYFQFKLKQNDAITAFRIAEAQVRRVLFEYYYDGEQPRAHGADAPAPDVH